jgi:hypothetical protein
MRKIQRFSFFLLCTVCCVLFAVSGCGYAIHGKASLPLDAIQIGTIDNRTFEPKLQDRLYQALTEEFLRQGISVLPVAGHKLTGSINRFNMRVIAEKGDIAADYEVIINGDFRFSDPTGTVREFKNIGSPFIVSFSGTGSLANLVASKEAASDEAIKNMASEIIAALFYK